MILTQHQLDRGAAYLKACGRDGIISGGYSWRDICAILDVDCTAGAGVELFDALRDCGRLVDLEPLPGTYGHSRFTVDAQAA